MSYTNQQTTWLQKQGSIGGAIFINGLLVAGLMLTHHVVEPKPKERPTTWFDVEPLKDPPEIIEPEVTSYVPPVIVPKPPLSPPANQERYIADTIDKPVSAIAGGTATGIDAANFPTPIEPVIEKIIEPIIPDPIFIGAQRDPKYANRFQPIYPGTLLRQEVEGKVRLTFLIGADGHVKSVKILSASHPRFAAAAEKQALQKWRFIPATRDGKAVEEWQTITISFNIN